MRTAYLLLIPIVLLFVSASDPCAVHSVAIIEFTHDGSNLERSVEEQMDALLKDLPEGQRVELHVVAEHEVRNDYAEACRLSYQRCQTLVSYLASRGIDEYNVAIHRYRGHLLIGSRRVSSPGSSGRGFVHTLSFTRHPGLPLMFTHSGLGHVTDACLEHGLNNSRPQVIYHSSGAELHIPPFAFESYSGYDPDCASINLRFCYFATTGDFIAADITSNSGKHMLESGGMVFIGATCLGADLRLKKGIQVRVVLPKGGDSGETMTLFLGREQYGIINWNVSHTGKLVQTSGEGLGWGEEVMVTEEEPSYLDNYVLTIGRLGWINVDRFYEVTRPQRLAVELGEQKREISVRMVFRDINSVLPGYYYDRDSLVMFEGLPAGESVKVVAYGKLDDQFYWDSREVVIGETSLLKLDARPVTSGVFDEMIAGF